MEALDIYDYFNLKEEIKKRKSPIFVERDDGQKIAIVLTPEARLYYEKRGFVSFVLDELFEMLLAYETLKEQKSAINSILETVSLFQGKVKKIKGG